MKVKFSIALLIAFVPGFAQAKPHSASAHMRPSLFHDRTPKPHPHEVHTRGVKAPQPKSPPPPAVKEEY
jgi:hypothetical protein